MTETEIEQALIQKLGDLKYSLRPDIRDRNSSSRRQLLDVHLEAP